MARIARLTPDQLDEHQRVVYDAIASGPRTANGVFSLTDEDGGLEGPFNAMLLHPAIGDALQRLGAAIRYRGELSDRAREIAILMVAAHRASRFERYAHEAAGARAGLTADEMAALREGIRPDLADPAEAAVAAATERILAHRTLTDAEYQEIAAVVGPAGVFELTTLIGYYELLALQLRIFDADQIP
ncbi:carboxymuconolactone decarboxylase family protein [Amycolatopsis pigmentata]|uniref:Carboxymuconolactone decarboxylase family protein n=1 Tax=Amycolatopsis pigmentata TaxID=450801 RepID=A0ABW5FKK2_9PSEU